MVAKYLAKHCPSTHQLEAFLASRSQELLINNGRMLACVQAIHKSKKRQWINVGSSYAMPGPVTHKQLNATLLSRPLQFTDPILNQPTEMGRRDRV